MSQEAIIEMFKESGALLEGHFLLTSGKHSNQYVQCAQVLQYPQFTEALAREMANQLQEKVELVVGPAMGGIIVAYEVARALGVPTMFTERQNGEMMLRRGFQIKPGQKILVVEDVVTTGGSVKEVIDIVRAHGGEVVAVGALVDRSGQKVDFGVPLISLLKLDIKAYDAPECPMCQSGSQPVKPGSRS